MRRASSAVRRIGILTPSLAGQGAERKALSIAAGLLERGHEVDLLLERLVCHFPDEVPGRVRIFYASNRSDARTSGNLDRVAAPFEPLVPNPVQWRVRFPRAGLVGRLPWRNLHHLTSTRLPRWAAGTAEYLNRHQPDAILAMNVLATAAASIASQLSRHDPRMIATLHEPLKHGRLLRRARSSYPFADAVVGVSHGVASEFERIPGLSRDRVHVIYNPIVSDYLRRGRHEPADHPWFDGLGVPVIIAVGKLIERKDYTNLLTAFSILVSRQSARLIVLGEGRLRRKLLALVDDLRIREYVDFPGFVENPFAFLAKSNLFVLSSRNEALPTVLVEAMACGCPVVSTDCPYGPREILGNGRLGALVPVGDSEALATAMFRALREPPRTEELQKRASFFGTERAVDRYEELLLRRD